MEFSRGRTKPVTHNLRTHLRTSNSARMVKNVGQSQNLPAGPTRDMKWVRSGNSSDVMCGSIDVQIQSYSSDFEIIPFLLA